MKKYETFNPTIPEPEIEEQEQDQVRDQEGEESTQSEPIQSNLPPFKEPAPAPAPRVAKKKKEKPKAKDKRQQPQPRPRPEPPRPVKVKKEPGPPITDVIKAWATSQTTRWLVGLFLGFFGVYLGVSFLAYLTSCIKDQSEINNVAIGAAKGISNAGGEGGARMSEFLINECFGLGAGVIVFWLIAMSLKQLVGKPRFKSVDFTIKSIVALITVSLIIGLLTVGFDTSVNWGGYHGRYVNEFIIRFVGWTGAGILCLFLICCFVVICLRDLINWIIKIRNKRAEKRRIEEAEREAIRARERELEEMRKREEADAAKAGDVAMPDNNEEPEDPGNVSFTSEDTGLYTSLPDFEDDAAYLVDSEDRKNKSLHLRGDETYAETTESKDVVEPVEYPAANVETIAETSDVTAVMDGLAANKESVAQETAGIINGAEKEKVEVSQPVVSSVAAPVVEEVKTEVSAQESTERAPEKAVDGAAAKVAEMEVPDEQAGDDLGMVVTVNEIAQAAQQRDAQAPMLPGMHPYKFPPAELLREGVERISVDANEQIENKEKIQKTLLDFGISITSIEATVGPTVTLYEIVPDRGVKINRIRNLVDDIALSLAATGVRIIAPIPGKGTVGIEVANKDAQTVSMRTVIRSHKYRDTKYKLPIAIGSTISNEVYIADLAKMPHLLVAGATGQGKSVGLNAIIASLLYKKTPDELKFVMIDPKMVEFSLYAKIEAHYLAKIPDAEDAIITDMDKVVATLSSLCVEMDNRYQLLKAAHTRNIEEYNDKIKDKRLNPLEGHRFLPYIVVVVDEFSDLIMTAGKEVEIPIARLAQKARAVGMHVIIATQRPSTNVITGIIKANFPARIAFKVSSGVDSKTILDTPGAQQLIGRGDMLISNNAPMVRVQCAFIDTPEVEAICDYIERQPYGQGAYELPEPVVEGSGDSDGELGNNFGDRDPLFDEVARLIVTSNTASTSSLQRRYSIGYNRAGKIMDQLEAAGIVGPAHGGKPRSVLVDSIALESILKP